MLFPSKEIILKNGQKAILRSPSPDDAPEMLAYLKQSASETGFLLKYPEECDMPVEKEIELLESINSSDNSVMILCEVDGHIAGNCSLSFRTRRIKTRHRAGIGIAILQQYWGLGIGTAMFREMIALAKERGVLQLELEYIEGNERGRALYEKMGFTAYGEHPDAIQLKDGTLLKEILMMKKL